MRGDIFYFMRKQPVDVLRYLPWFLSKDSTFKAICDALSRQHEAYRLKLVDIARQFYLETATWGLADWEQFLRINPVKGATDDFRRTLVRVKRRGDTLMTVENTKRLLADFAPYGAVDIEELGANRLKLVLNDGNFYWDELMDALWEQLPAHLIFSFDINADFGIEDVFVGIAQADATSEGLDLSFDSPNAATFFINSTLFDLDAEDFAVDCGVDSSLVFNNFAVIESEAICEKIDCDRSELGDVETIEAFERYLRRRWVEFRQNPVIQHYAHGGQYEGELDDSEDPENFPVAQDFLRLYWKFDCGDKSKWHLRYQTILNPREDIDGREIRSLGEIGAAGQILLHSKSHLPTIGILRALYIRKSTAKII